MHKNTKWRTPWLLSRPVSWDQPSMKQERSTEVRHTKVRHVRCLVQEGEAVKRLSSNRQIREWAEGVRLKSPQKESERVSPETHHKTDNQCGSWGQWRHTNPVTRALDVHASLGQRGFHAQTERAVAAFLGVGVHHVAWQDKHHTVSLFVYIDGQCIVQKLFLERKSPEKQTNDVQTSFNIRRA